MRPTLVQLSVAEPAPAWEALGFAVAGDSTRIGTVEVSFAPSETIPAPSGSGLVGWALTGLAGTGTVDVDGLETTLVEPPPAVAPAQHLNGALSIDHVVVMTPDLSRTLDRLAETGLELRRTRDAGERMQAFYRVGEAILEVVGPHQPDGDGPARLWGFVCTVEDLDATGALLGPALGPSGDAVQPGRRIATVTRAAGIGVPLAFMSPDRPRNRP